MIIVSVIVYNRLHNLKRWIQIWNECKPQAELIIIHTGAEDWKKYCTGATYIHRKNQGFDIGAFQDVCRGRLNGFPKDWDYLLWCADDTIPMTKDFLTPFIKALDNPKIGISCMKISDQVKEHVRTTGFCLKAQTAAKLTFPADPITTKQQCYLFEHRGQTLISQVRSMGLECIQVAPDNISPLWDTGYGQRLDRLQEHYKTFPPEKQQSDKVTFICTVFNTYPQIISSLLLQTHKNWELILIHDGPSTNGMKSYIPNDERIKYIETKERKGHYGHPWRQWALNEISGGRLSEDTGYIVVGNADNYLVPVFTEYLLKGFNNSHTAVATYCDAMVHSYKAWQVIPCKLERGYVDCSGVMIRKEIACEVGWRDTKGHSADWTFFADIATRYSWKNFLPVKGCLLVHN